MKKIKNLSEGSFLKLFFAVVTAAFLIAAVCMPDRAQMFTGLWNIMTNPSKLSSNYFSIGGLAGTFLNVGLVCLINLAVFHFTKATVNNVSTLAFLLTAGFCTWGINVLNVWPIFAGVALGCLIKKEKLSAGANAMLFSTGVAPIVSEMLFRYPHAEIVGFNVLGIILGIVVGIAAGLLIPAGLPHSPKVHKGLDLYSAALPVGMTAFFFNGLFYKIMGIDVPGAPGDLAVASAPAINIFCGVLFALFVIFGLIMGGGKGYWNLLKNRHQVNNVSGTCGNAVFLMNVGVYGLFILAYYNAIGANFNAVTLGLVFCMLSCCNSGSRPTNVWPIMLGYVVASFGAQWISGLLGGSFSLSINAAAIAVGLCFASGLSPICDKYGWHYGFIAAILHYILVTLVPGIHGGFCLYNGGFTAVFVCILMVPVLEKFCKTKEERLAQKANKV